jgi:TNF receptor-associated protein 1
MKEGQKEIYFLLGSSRESIENGPYLEAFKANGLEVLFLYEGVDEFVMSHLGQHQEKKLVSADQEGIELDSVAVNKNEAGLGKKEADDLCSWLKEIFGEQVSEVKVSKRLVDNPAMVLNKDRFMTSNMRRIMKAMNRDVPSEMPVQLEINPDHPVMARLHALRVGNEDTAKLVAEQLLDNCRIAAGLLDDPQSMVKRIYRLMESVS